MARTIVIEGNAVYELDDDCMLRKVHKQQEEKGQMDTEKEENKNREKME